MDAVVSGRQVRPVSRMLLMQAMSCVEVMQCAVAQLAFDAAKALCVSQKIHLTFVL